MAKAKGIAIDVENPAEYIRNFAKNIPGARPSMAQDHAARKISEVDAINGAIPREAEKVGLTAPVNAFVTAVIKARESIF